MPKVVIRIVIVAIILLAVAAISILSTLSWSVPIALSKFLETQDISLSIEKSRISLLKGEISLSNVQIAGAASAAPATIENVSLKIDSERLVRERFVAVEYLLADGVTAELTKNAEGYSLNSIALPTENSAAQAAGPPGHQTNSAPPIEGFLLRNVKLNDATIKLADAEIDTQTVVTLGKIVIEKFNSLQPDEPTELRLELGIDDAELKVNGQAKPLSSNPEGTFDIEITSFGSELLTKLLHFFPNTDNAQTSLEGLDFAFNFKTKASLLQNAVSNQVLLVDPSLDISSLEYTSSGSDDRHQYTFDGLLAASKVDFTAELVEQDKSNSQAESTPAVIVQAFTMRDGNASQKQIAQGREDVATSDAMNLRNIDVDIDKLNTASSTQSNISLTAENGKHGTLAVSGSMNLLDYASDTALEINGKQVDLLPFSPTLEEVLNRRVKSGLLNFDSSLTIEARQLLVSNNLQIDQFVLGKSQLDKNQQDINIGLPLNTALNLLRDKRDRIVLELPVSGSIDDPNFSLNPILRKAIFKSVKSAVTTQVGPLLAISAIGKARDLSDALRLQAIPFEFESTLLSQEAKLKTNKLAEFLLRRQTISIRLCPYLNAREKTSQPATDASKNLQGEAFRRFIAAERTDAVKNSLIEQGIEGQRIVPCAYEVEEQPDSSPRIQPSF